MIDLRDSSVLITGGSRGIGASCCRLFAEAGARVALHYHTNVEAADAVFRSLPDVEGASHMLLQADLGNPSEVERLTRELGSAWKSLDCLVNNAGIWERNEIREFDARAMSRTWELNVMAPFLTTHLVLPLMDGRPDANIVNITSTAGQRGEACYSPYAASKGALISTTKSWAAELAPDIRVNSVAPGWVDTDMSSGAFAAGGRGEIESTIPLARIGTADEIAGGVLFLASPLARDVTGEILNVNGGSVLCG